MKELNGEICSALLSHINNLDGTEAASPEIDELVHALKEKQNALTIAKFCIQSIIMLSAVSKGAKYELGRAVQVIEKAEVI